MGKTVVPLVVMPLVSHQPDLGTSFHSTRLAALLAQKPVNAVVVAANAALAKHVAGVGGGGGRGGVGTHCSVGSDEVVVHHGYEKSSHTYGKSYT